ncbi:MAG: TetR/AcrR family transcriptional regulator, partial [Alphaproteobacteria bacterium]
MGLRQKAKEKRRKLVLIAARGLIVDQGVGGLNMRALAEAAELSVATLYNHFGSKEELLQALLDQSFDTLNAASTEVKADDAITRAQQVVTTA